MVNDWTNAVTRWTDTVTKIVMSHDAMIRVLFIWCLALSIISVIALFKRK